MPNQKATAEEFVRIWQAATSTADVATELGMTVNAAASKASRYRKAGVPLKDLRVGNNAPDYKALAELARSLNGHG
jgi:hypothetical protein